MTTRDRERAVLGGLVLMLVSTTELWLLYDQPTIRHVSEVLWLAAFLGLTVDRFLKQRFASQVAKNVGPYLFSYEVPEAIRDEVLYARRISLIRQSVEIDLAFKDAGPGALKMITTTRYTLVNFSDQKLKTHHAAAVWQDKFPLRGRADILNVEAVGADLKPQYRHGPGQVAVKRSPVPPVCSFAEPIEVEPNSTSRNNYLLVRTLQYVDENDEDCIFFPDPIIGISVRVSEKPDNLEVGVLFGHRKYAEIKSSPKDEPTLWKFNGAFLHWGAASISWRPRPSTASTAGTADTAKKEAPA